jgi:hypothetical protein
VLIKSAISFYISLSVQGVWVSEAGSSSDVFDDNVKIFKLAKGSGSLWGDPYTDDLSL